MLAPAVERAGDLALLVGRRLERALERGGRGIVDRADQAGDIARGRGLAPAILDAAARFAFEIDDEDVVLDDQHLSEMKIAMMADLHCVDVLRQQFAQSRGQRFRTRQERVDQLAIILRQVRSATRQLVERRGRRAAGRLSVQARTSSAAIGSGAKSAMSSRLASASCISATRRPTCSIRRR